MNLTNSATGQSLTIRADNVVAGPEGHLLVEAMFSKLVDLSAPSANLAERLHPAKAKAFEWIVAGQCTSVVPSGREEGPAALPAGESLRVVPEVELHVNRPEGGILVRRFSEFLDRHKELLERGACGDVRRTIPLAGFDPDAEPIVREMRDGSLLLIVGCLPPLVAENDASKAQQFDMNAFGAELEKAVGLPVLWDDREVFVVQRPEANTVERIRQFFGNYWKSRGKPWWKFW